MKCKHDWVEKTVYICDKCNKLGGVAFNKGMNMFVHPDLEKEGILFEKPKIVLVYGSWDLMHRGHRRFLKRAKKLGDRLFVGVLMDKYLTKYKRKPIFNETDRLETIRDLSYVDNAFCVGENSYEIMMETIKPDLVVHGSDWKDAPSILLAKKLGIKTKIIPSTKGISTSKIINKIIMENSSEVW